MKAKLFQNSNTLIIRNFRGERRLHFSNFHRLLAFGIIGILAALLLFFSSEFAFSRINASNGSEISRALLEDYELRIDALSSERDLLAENLAASQANSGRLISSLGSQQDLLFELEQNNYELDFNLGNLREQLINAQTNLDTLHLKTEAQQIQLIAIETGTGTANSSTLTTITEALSETARARDTARTEVQNLRQTLAENESRIAAENKRRDILMGQIEDAIEVSLVPMKSTLSNTGLNVDRLIDNVRKNYSGVGGLSNDVDTGLLSFSPDAQDRMDKLLGNLDELSSLSFAIQSLPLGKPVKANYRMSSAFGYRRHPITGRSKLHAGQDMAGPVGTPIYAPGNGKVTTAGWNSGYGKTIVIQHSNGIKTRYGHLSRLRVKVGDQVSLGDRIGDMGSTGQSTGSHLHYEIHVNGVPANPMNFLKASHYVQ